MRGFGAGRQMAIRQKAGTSRARKGAAASSRTLKRKPKGTGAAFVHDALREDILNLKLTPGELLDEGELSARFGVSRSPVREALIRLASEGLVQTLRNRSSMVARFDVQDLPSYFDSLDLIYRATARLAAGRRTDVQVETLKIIQHELEAAHAANDALQIVKLNRDFHILIAAASHNRWFESWISTILDHGQRLMRLHIMHRRERIPLEQLQNHRILIEAIAVGDADRAEDAAAADAKIVRDQMATILADQATAPIRL